MTYTRYRLLFWSFQSLLIFSSSLPPFGRLPFLSLRAANSLSICVRMIWIREQFLAWFILVSSSALHFALSVTFSQSVQSTQSVSVIRFHSLGQSWLSWLVEWNVILNVNLGRFFDGWSGSTVFLYWSDQGCITSKSRFICHLDIRVDGLRENGRDDQEDPIPS